MIFEGWVDEVDDGIVWGRILYEGAECEFKTPFLDVPECQRVDLAPGSYITVVNGYIAVNKSIWTTHDMEQADAEAKELHDAIFAPELTA